MTSDDLIRTEGYQFGSSTSSAYRTWGTGQEDSTPPEHSSAASLPSRGLAMAWPLPVQPRQESTTTFKQLGRLLALTTIRSPFAFVRRSTTARRRPGYYLLLTCLSCANKWRKVAQVSSVLPDIARAPLVSKGPRGARITGDIAVIDVKALASAVRPRYHTWRVIAPTDTLT